MDAFEAASLKMEAYLRSEEFATREDAEDTQASIPLLIDIIRAGMVTADSQEGVCKPGFNPDAEHYYEGKERAYLEGFMPSKQAERFVEVFNTETDKIAFVVESVSGSEFFDIYAKQVTGNIPVTVERSGDSAEELATNEFHPFSIIATVLPEKYMEFEKEKAALTGADVKLVAVIDPVYCRASSSQMYTEIVRCIVKSRM